MHRPVSFYMITLLNVNIFHVTAISAENSPTAGEFPSQRLATRSFDVFFDLRLNKRLSKQWRRRGSEAQSRSFWRHSNARTIKKLTKQIIWGTESPHIFLSPGDDLRNYFFLLRFASTWPVLRRTCFVIYAWSLWHFDDRDANDTCLIHMM